MFGVRMALCCQESSTCSPNPGCGTGKGVGVFRLRGAG